MRISDWSSDVCSSDLFLNSQHQVLACEPLFKGTVSEASVYPRVVVQRALELNASALIFSHQHPSGTTEPSMADRAITNRLKFILGIDLKSTRLNSSH